MDDAGNQRAHALKSLLLIAHMAVGVFLVESARYGGEWTKQVLYGLFHCQVGLVALWTGLARRNVFLRWGCLALLIGVWTYLTFTPYGDYTRLVCDLAWQASLVVLASVLLHFLGIHLADDMRSRATAEADAAEAGSQAGTAKLQLAHTFAITSSVAIMAATAHLRSMPLSSLLTYANNCGIHSAIAVASAWAVLAPGRWQKRTALVLVCSFLLGPARFAVNMLAAEIDFTIFGVSPWFQVAGSLGFEAVLLCISLGVFRACGYRLISVEETPAAAEESAG